MVKLKGPLMSLEARGRFGNAIIFQHQKGRAVAKRFAKPKNPKSSSQSFGRAGTAFFTKRWRELTDTERESWHGLSHPGWRGAYAEYLKYNMSRWNLSPNGCAQYGADPVALAVEGFSFPIIDYTGSQYVLNFTASEPNAIFYGLMLSMYGPTPQLNGIFFDGVYGLNNFFSSMQVLKVVDYRGNLDYQGSAMIVVSRTGGVTTVPLTA